MFLFFSRKDDVDTEDIEPPALCLPQLDGPFDSDQHFSSPSRTKDIGVRETFVPLGSAQTLKQNAVILDKTQDCHNQVRAGFCHKISQCTEHMPVTGANVPEKLLPLGLNRVKRTKGVNDKRVVGYCDINLSDEEDFVIPQFDGANDVILRRGRRQQASHSNPNAQQNVDGNAVTEAPQRQTNHSGRSTSVNTRDVIRENILKRNRGGESRGSQAPLPLHNPHSHHGPHLRRHVTSPSVPYSTSSQGPVPSSLSNVPGNSLTYAPSDSNFDTVLNLPDFIDISSHMTSGEAQSPSIISNSASQGNSHSQAKSKSSRGSRKIIRQPELSTTVTLSQESPQSPVSVAMTGTMNITPLSSIGVSQRVPGIGNALVVPALVTNTRVSVSGLGSSHVIVPSDHAVQQPGSFKAGHSSLPSAKNQQPSALMMVSQASSSHITAVSHGNLQRLPDSQGHGRHESAVSQSYISQQTSSLQHSNQPSGYPEVPSQIHKVNRRSYKTSPNVHPPLQSPQHSLPSSKMSKYDNAGPLQVGEQSSQGTSSAGVPGSLKTMVRQNSEQSAYSPISDESDTDVPGSTRKLHTNNDVSGTVVSTSKTIETSNKEDILKQAFDMTLFDGIDLEVEPMDANDNSFQNESDDLSLLSSRMSYEGRTGIDSSQQNPLSTSCASDFDSGNAAETSDNFEDRITADKHSGMKESTKRADGNNSASDNSWHGQIQNFPSKAVKEVAGSSVKLTKKDKKEREKTHSKQKKLR